MSAPLNDLPEKRLTIQEEKQLAKKIQSGDEAARLTLVLHTMREAISYARRVTRGNIPDSQLASACYDVLYRGAVRFKPQFGRFFAFCKVGVRGWCRNIWKDRDVVKGGFTFSNDTATGHSDRPKPNHASDYAFGANDIWDDEPRVSPDYEIAEPDFKSILTRERMVLISDVMRKVCSLKERQIIELAYIAGYNFKEIGDKLGVSRAATQATNAKALRKIRCELYRKKRLFND